MNVTEEQISAMKTRLKNRQEERRAEADIDEAIALVSKHRFFNGAPVEKSMNSKEPELRMISHEIITMARRMKLVEDLFGFTILAVWAVLSILAIVSWRTGSGIPGVWLAAAEICLLPYLVKVPNDVSGRRVT